MDRTGIIELEGMEFYSHHGVLDREKAVGNLFVVDFSGKADLSKCAISDCLEDTSDYSQIYDLVAKEMAVPSDLLENVAGRIVQAIEENFPEFQSFSVRVSKRRPPVRGVIQWSRVTLTHNKEENEE